MTVTTGLPSVVDVVADIAKSDEGTARLIVEMVTYDALCEEIDVVRPALDREVGQVVAKRVHGALEAIAKRYPTATASERADLEQTAESLLGLVNVGKADEAQPKDNPQTPWWDARIPAGQEGAGQFTALAAGPRGHAYRTTADALRIFATGQDPDTSRVMGAHLDRIASGNKYQRASALGAGLQQISHPAAQAAGTFVRMVGDIGPEAERVFGHGIRRLAYRYRGTERRPNPQYRQVVQGRLARLESEGQLTEQNRLRIVSDAGAGFLWPQVPNQHLAEISLKAGRMPPSRGIIFDAQGNPVVEAMGYNGDHYLPFDLKNLKRLRGGSYVRTRTTGGLTDEDIYTGLMTGAREVTVVSNSGVFSIEFDPSLRGGRRYSDKARQMVDRYASLVATIGSEKVLAQDISPQRKAELRQIAYDKARGNEKIATDYYKDALEQEQFASKFVRRDDDELLAIARTQAVKELQGKPGGDQVLARRTRDIHMKMRTEEREKAVRVYRLDGEGYKAAQSALAQEFPYFIRSQQAISAATWLSDTGRLGPDDDLPPRPSKDIGYTRRNSLAPSNPKRGEEEEEKKPKAEATGEKTETSPDKLSRTWAQAASSPDIGLEQSLSQALDKSLSARGRFDDMMPPVSDVNPLDFGDEQWSAWALTTHHGPAGVARWLLLPTTDQRHLQKAIDSLGPVEIGVKARELGGHYNQFDKARELLRFAQMARDPWASPAKDMVLADPDPTQFAPQPFPEVVDQGPNLRKLVEVAHSDPEVAQYAQDTLDTDKGERTLVDAIRNDLSKVNIVHNWPDDEAGRPDPENPRAGGFTPEDVDLYRADPNTFAPYADLEKRQKAWALARAVRIAVGPEGKVPELVPKEEHAKSLGKRAPLPRRNSEHLSMSSVRKSRSAPLPPSSNSFIDDVIAARLAEDPEYLEQLMSRRR